jgi:hypothetical protein
MKLTKLALACALTGALAACGGGGSNPTIAGGIDTTRTLAGIAAKGLIKNGIVEVFSYDATGKKSTQPLVTTRTATDGSYSVSLGNNIGLFTIEVRADANTTMADEISHKDIAMPLGMTLRSVVQLDSAASTAIKGYVTPFTEMLVNAAINANGGLTASNVAAAQSGVIKMLGFNPLATKPINADSDAAAAVTDTSEQLQSLALAAISRMASDGNLGCAQATISEKIKCIVDASTGSASLKDSKFSISLAAQVAIRDALAAVAADPTVNKTKLDTIDGQTMFTQASVSTSSTVETPIASAKALFASLRTNIQAWSDAFNGGAAAKSASALKSDFDAAIVPVDKSLADWMLISERGIVFLNDYVAGKTLSNYVTFQSNSLSYEYFSPTLGGCTIYADAAFTIPVNKPSEAKGVACSLTPRNSYVSGTYNQNGGSYTYLGMTKSIRLVPVSGSTTNFTYMSRTRVQTTQYTYSNIYPYTSTSTPATGYVSVGDYGPTGFANGTVSFVMSGTALTGATIKGFMPARTNDAGVAITDQEAWNVSYARTLEADKVTYKYALSGDITALKGGATVGSIALQDGSFIRAISDKGVQDVKQVNLALTVASKNSKVVGNLSLNDFSANKKGNNVIPTSLKFTGSFSNAGAEFFNGTLTAKTSNYASYDDNVAESATNFMKASVAFTGIAKIPNRPDLSLTLSARNTAFESYAYSGQYDDGTNTILVNSADVTGARTVDVFSANGVSMQFIPGVNKVDVKKNNSIIASFNQSAGIINYTDGSFESLK